MDILVLSDYYNVLKHSADPNLSINPDAVGYVIVLKDGTSEVGPRIAETEQELQITQPGGAVAILAKTDLVSTKWSAVSL